MIQRWSLTTLDGSETYTVAINPNAAESALRDQSLSWFLDTSAGFTGVRKKRQPVAWSFSGVVRSQDHYDALLEWSRKRRTVRIVTDLGEALVVRITGFQPGRTAPPRFGVEWRHTYKMNALVFSYDTGSGFVQGDSTSGPGSGSARGAATVSAVAGTVLSNGANIVGLAALVTGTAPGSAGSANGGAVIGRTVTLVAAARAGRADTGWVNGTGAVASITAVVPAGSAEV